METITHDFKIPTLAQLRGAELLRNGAFGSINNEQKKMILEIENSCKHVLNMISMFTGAYNIEKNKYKLKYETFNLYSVIFSCFDDLYKKTKEKNITFEYVSKNNDITLEADKSEIKKVITNLLISAIDYSSQNGKIIVKILENKNNVYMYLSGMNLLYTSPNSKRNEYTTIGQTMGMYLCKKIVELHGGKFYIPDSNKNIIKFFIPRYPVQKRTADNLCYAE